MADFFGSSLVSELSLIICHIHFINLSVFIYTGAKTHSCKHGGDVQFFLSFSTLPTFGNMTDLDSTLKRRDITLLTKVPIVKAVFFPVVTCGHKN